MIDRNGSLYDIYCDGESCTADLEITADDWQEMIQQIKDEDWVSIPDGRGNFDHLCPECKKKRRQKHE